MNEINKIYSLGTKVKFGKDRDIEGKISAVTLRPFIVMYEISFWASAEYKSIWLSDQEFDVSRKKVMKLGFIREENDQENT